VLCQKGQTILLLYWKNAGGCLCISIEINPWASSVIRGIVDTMKMPDHMEKDKTPNTMRDVMDYFESITSQKRLIDFICLASLNKMS
jgi:hypothetical protein